MAATTMLHISKLVERIKNDFEAYVFEEGELFRWSPQNRTITHLPLTDEKQIWTLLHEIAHGELDHQGYEHDIQLLRCETEAWHYAAKTLAKRYDLAMDDNYIQDQLDTYRGWLHERSTCPKCKQNGLQTKTNTYRCINCRCLWHVNDALFCRLKRTRL
ncbi:MAG: hypothetical protein ACREGJ_00295 [Candidatus Saccharimonadales bacterium]